MAFKTGIIYSLADQQPFRVELGFAPKSIIFRAINNQGSGVGHGVATKSGAVITQRSQWETVVAGAQVTLPGAVGVIDPGGGYHALVTVMDETGFTIQEPDGNWVYTAFYQAFSD